MIQFQILKRTASFSKGGSVNYFDVILSKTVIASLDLNLARTVRSLAEKVNSTSFVLSSRGIALMLLHEIATIRQLGAKFVGVLL